jgi:hypothetical protein
MLDQYSTESLRGYCKIPLNIKMSLPTEEAACSQFDIFYRLCGHVEYSHKPTTICTLGLKLRGINDNSYCWNRLPAIRKPRYVVGRCLECLRRTEDGRELGTEPARNVEERGNNIICAAEEEHSPERIRELALAWKFEVEEDERVSRVEDMRRERALDVRRESRRMMWRNAWAKHCANTVPGVGSERAKILDLTDDFSCPRTIDDLLDTCRTDPDSSCFCCELLSEPPLHSSDEREAPKPVRFINGCGHEFHWRCIVEWLVVHENKTCPVCRAGKKFILTNDYEDPKFRWKEDDYNGRAVKRVYQVSGFIDFSIGLDNPNNHPSFHPFLGEDRWGDHEGH